MKSFILLIIVFLSCSCTGLLQEEPYGTFSNNNFYKTEADAESALLYAYAPLNDIEYMLRTVYELIDIPTNECVDYGINVYEHTMYRWEDPSEEFFFNFYRHPYLSIQRANSLLENIEKISFSSNEKKNKIIGEAKFLLAFNYFMLVRTFGEVPLRKTSTTSIDQVVVPNSNIQDIYDYIIKNLEESIELQGIEKHQGRIDRVASQALLAKVYLTLASSKDTGAPGYDWVSDKDEMYKKSASYSLEVLTKQNVYSLDPDLGNVYDVNSQMTSPEHIMITSCNRKGNGPEGSYSQLQAMFGPQITGIYIANSPNTVVIDEKNVKPFQDPEMSSWMGYRTDSTFYKQFTDNDLRKKLFLTTIYNSNGSIRLTWNSNNYKSTDPDVQQFFYPACLKYTDPYSIRTVSSANTYIIRFADVALMYAEAVGPTTDGYEWVNKVRNRANLPELTPDLSLSDFRDSIYVEREKELCFEGHALFDLRRLNRVNSKYITNKAINNSFAYFYPIPNREIDLNK